MYVLNISKGESHPYTSAVFSPQGVYVEEWKRVGVINECVGDTRERTRMLWFFFEGKTKDTLGRRVKRRNELRETDLAQMYILEPKCTAGDVFELRMP